MGRALLLIDIQNDYFPGGALEVPGSNGVSVQAVKLLGLYRKLGLPIVHIQHLSLRPNATYLVPETNGVQIHETVSPAEGETVFQKHFPNSFRETPLLDHLRRHHISQLTIAGMMTQMCIDTTTRAASDLGFQCALAQDACAARPLTFQGVTVPSDMVHAAFLASLNGMFANVISSDDICASLKNV
jgi:nicotinamidase-related amidase